MGGECLQGLPVGSTCPPSPRRAAPSPTAAVPDLRIGSGMRSRVTWQSHCKLAWGLETAEAAPVPGPSALLGCRDEAAGLGCVSGWGSQGGLLGGRTGEAGVWCVLALQFARGLRLPSGAAGGVYSKHKQLLVSGVLCCAVCPLHSLLSWSDCVK